MYFDGKKAPIEALGNRDFRFAVKNGLQNALIIYHKSDKRSQARMFLVGYQLREPISVSAKNHLAATNFLIQPSEPPIVIRRKIGACRGEASRSELGQPAAFNLVWNSIVGLWESGFKYRPIASRWKNDIGQLVAEDKVYEFEVSGARSIKVR